MWASLRNRLTIVLCRRRIHARMSRSVRDAWPLIARVFSESDAVYSGPVGASGRLPFQSRLIDLLVQQRGESEEVFACHLEHSDALVVAYCLVGLQRLHSRKLEQLPTGLLERSEPIVFRGGCFYRRLTLGQLASELTANCGAS